MPAAAKAAHHAPVRLLLAAGAAACALAGGAGEGLAQQRVRPGETVSQPVVQPLPNQDNLRLNAALSRLGRNPRDLDALIDAGSAALALGDVDAATGFFKRADQVSTNDARVKAGLGGALVRSGNPLDAIDLFDAAERAGAEPASLAADRGLAYDLIGDNATAQRLYRVAMTRGDSDEVTRRMALSQAIVGDRRNTEATLLPLLRRQDKPAWRTRIFALAILGQADEAIRTAHTILPQPLAESMAPYLRYMPQLTKAQQAAAANLGSFPRASEIGRDDPRFAQFLANARPTASVAAADATLVPRGEPLGRAARTRTDRQAAPPERPTRVAARTPAVSPARPAERIAPPEPQPTRELAEPAAAPPVAASRPAAPPPSMAKPITASAAPAVPQLATIASPRPATVPAPAQPPAATTPAPVPAPAPAPARPAAAAAPVARPGFDLARLPDSQTVAPPPQPAPPPPPVQTAPPPPAPAPAPAAPVQAGLDAPSSRISLAEAFRDLGPPQPGAAPVAPGAVDIRRLAAAKPKPPEKLAPKPAPPSHPSRIWVQIGVGRDKSALAIDWRKYLRQTAALKGRAPYISDMGRTNRLLVGPFDSAAKANKFVSDLRGSELEGAYLWTSPAGQVVDTLPIR